MPINRLTAHKVWISDMLLNPYIKTSGEFESNYVELKDKQVSRVNLIATVVDKMESNDKNYVALVLDDGTGQIRLKTWREDTRLINNFNIGDNVIVIGRIKNYNDELYLLPEIVKNVNLNWKLARKLELLKLYGKPNETHFVKPVSANESEEKVNIEEINFSSTNLRKEILGLIEKYEDKLGVTLEEMKAELHVNISEIYNVLEDLIKDGQVYTVSNKYRLLV